MKHTKLTDHLDAITINPATEVLVVSGHDFSEAEQLEIAQWSRYTGLNILFIPANSHITVVEKENG